LLLFSLFVSIAHKPRSWLIGTRKGEVEERRWRRREMGRRKRGV